MSGMDRFVRWITGEGAGVPKGAPVHSSRTIDAVSENGLPPVQNNAGPYGVTIEEAQVEPGTEYWRVVRVYHLTPEENAGKHHIFLDARTPDGERAFDTVAHIVWEGGEHSVSLDKPVSEPAANFPMWKWQVCSVRLEGKPSDTVHNLRTDHPDEPNPDGSPSGNTLFHHSFLVEFQQVTAPEQTGNLQGQVENARPGLSARLLRSGRVVDSTEVADDGRFAFQSLRPGRYTVQVEDQQSDVQVDGGETHEVTLVVAPHRSVIEGTVQNGGGFSLRLVLDGDVLAEGSLGQSGTFRLRNLGPGTYFVQVTRPDAMVPILKSSALVMDGTNTRRVDLTVPVEGEEQGSPFSHYILFGAPDQPSTRRYLTALAPVLVEKRLAFGFNVQEAVLAKKVTVIGGDAVPESDVSFLTTKDIEVEQMDGSAQEIREKLAR